MVLLPASTWPINTTFTCFLARGTRAEGSTCISAFNTLNPQQFPRSCCPPPLPLQPLRPPPRPSARQNSNSSATWAQPPVAGVTRHTRVSHVMRMCHTSRTCVMHHTHTSHVTHKRHTSHITQPPSHVTRHTSHIPHHTSHVTRHTSPITLHTSHTHIHQLRRPSLQLSWSLWQRQRRRRRQRAARKGQGPFQLQVKQQREQQQQQQQQQEQQQQGQGQGQGRARQKTAQTRSPQSSASTPLFTRLVLHNITNALR
jgi:hypothetical protein